MKTAFEKLEHASFILQLAIHREIYGGKPIETEVNDERVTICFYEQNPSTNLPFYRDIQTQINTLLFQCGLCDVAEGFRSNVLLLDRLIKRPRTFFWYEWNDFKTQHTLISQLKKNNNF